MSERYPEAELVLDDELLYEDGPRRSTLLRRDERPEDIVREGEVLAGKYRVERIPGRNGLGVLVQVRHLELGQEVTLKFLVPEACAYPEFVQRFVREARAAVRIQGEHVARVTDVGRLESGAPYMVREYLRGPDLAEVLKVRGPLPISEAVDYIVQACEGVAEGHALGVVHRNLRPTSLVLARRSDGTPLVKVFDFAASESLHVNPFTERAVSLVGTSAIMASLPYLAPEQIRDPHDVDFRADVYSLGAVLFELLAGTPVYAAEAAPALLAQVAADPAPSLRSLRTDCPGELDHVVLRCLAKNRAIRYSSAAELVTALKPFASAESASSIERVVRLGKRTSKLPEAKEARVPSPLPPPSAPPAVSSVLPPLTPPPARGRHGTVLLHTAEPVSSQSVAPARLGNEDVTTINPYAAYGLPPVVIQPDVPRSEPAPRTEPLRIEPRVEPRIEPARIESIRIEPARVEPIRTEPAPRAEPPARSDTLRVEHTRTPQPPPLRTSVPPPLRAVAAAPVTEAPPAPAPISEMPPPGPRSSMSGLTRSWAVPDEPEAPLLSKLAQRRLIGVGAIAAFATLGAVLAFRMGASRASAPVAAAPLPPAPAKVAPPPAPPAPEPAPVDSAAVAPSASAVASAAPAVAAAPPVAVTPPAAVAPVPPAPVAVAPAAPKPVVAPRPVAPRRSEAVVETASLRKPAPEKVASSKPTGGGDLFDDPH